MRTLALFVAAGVCLAQTPAFDAASVKVADRAARPTPDSGGPGTTDPGRIHRCCNTMIMLLTEAYGVDIDQIAGPGWIADFMAGNRYQIDATIPPDTTKAQFELMFQNLLAERFGLKVHHEARNFPGYDLVVAKDGPKLKVTTQDPNAAADPKQRPVRQPDGWFKLGPGPRNMYSEGRGSVRLQAQAQPVSALMQQLWAGIPKALGADTNDFRVPRARVTDKTGLTGKYDFALEYACEGCQGLGAMAANLPLLAGRAQADAPPPSDAPSGLPTIFAALEKQLGLKLEKTKDVPLDVIVIDHIEKLPTEN